MVQDSHSSEIAHPICDQRIAAAFEIDAPRDYTFDAFADPSGLEPPAELLGQTATRTFQFALWQCLSAPGRKQNSCGCERTGMHADG